MDPTQVTPTAAATTEQVMGSLLQFGMLVALPFLATFAKRLMSASASEKNVDTISRLAAAAIDYVEHLDTRQQLETGQPAGANLDKLGTATSWLEQELKRNGIKMPADEAEQWIRSERQARVNELLPTDLIEQAAATAIADVLMLAETGRLTVPRDQDPLDYWSRLAADRAMTHLAQAGTTLSREDAAMWVRAAWLKNQLDDGRDLWRPPAATGSPVEQMARLRADAESFVRGLEARGLSIHGDDALWYLRVSRMLTEAARQGLELSVEDVFAAAAEARPAAPPAASD